MKIQKMMKRENHNLESFLYNMPMQRHPILFSYQKEDQFYVFINSALKCFGVDPKHFLRYKDLEIPRHRGFNYVGSWEDRITGLTSFSRLSPLFLERGVCVPDPVTIE
jgi:hypothetical protein